MVPPRLRSRPGRAQTDTATRRIATRDPLRALHRDRADQETVFSAYDPREVARPATPENA